MGSPWTKHQFALQFAQNSRWGDAWRLGVWSFYPNITGTHYSVTTHHDSWEVVPIPLRSSDHVARRWKHSPDQWMSTVNHLGSPMICTEWCLFLWYNSSHRSVRSVLNPMRCVSLESPSPPTLTCKENIIPYFNPTNQIIVHLTFTFRKRPWWMRHPWAKTTWSVAVYHPNRFAVLLVSHLCPEPRATDLPSAVSVRLACRSLLWSRPQRHKQKPGRFTCR